MNGEKCVICGKPMGNSAHTISGRPTHSHCFDERSRDAAQGKCWYCAYCIDGVCPECGTPV